MHFYLIFKSKDEFKLRFQKKSFISSKITNENIFIYLQYNFVNERQKFDGHCNMQMSFFLQFLQLLNVTSNTDKCKEGEVYQITTEELIEKLNSLNQSWSVQDRNLVGPSVLLTAQNMKIDVLGRVPDIYIQYFFPEILDLQCRTQHQTVPISMENF